MYSVTPGVITQLIYLNRTSGVSDATYMLWRVVICDVVVQNMSIITACIPYLKPFIQSLESGMIRTDDLRRRGLFDTSGYDPGRKDSHQLSDLSSRIARTITGLAASSIRTKSKDPLPFADREIPFTGQRSTTVTTASADIEARRDSDKQSQETLSQTIRQTKSYTVER